MSDETLEVLGGVLRNLRGDVEIYSRVSPENASEEKKAFEESLKGEIPIAVDASVSGEVVDELVEDTVSSSISPEDLSAEDIRNISPENPEFRYVDRESFVGTEEDLAELESDLDGEDVSETIKQVYRDTIDEGWELIRIAENIGDSEVVQDASRNIYGELSESTVRWAERTLEKESPAEDPRYTEGRFSASDMKSSLEKTLELMDMNDWEVDTREKGSVKVNAANQAISVPEERKFTENEMMRLLVHEVGTHALRGANGYSQDIQVLGAGAGGYHQAAEGIAFFLEEATGLSNPDNKRKYAGRVKSVESVMNGDEFAETYSMNREFGFDHNQSWSMALRAHRGGGFIKDHVYAEGFRQVEAYLKDEGELEDSSGLGEFAGMDGHLEDLMAGKVSVEQGYELRDEIEGEYSPMKIVENLDYLTPGEVDNSVVDVNPRLEEWYSAS